jgi:uncharacterized membrane protein
MEAVFYMKWSAKRIAYGSLAAALIMVATAVIKVPGPIAGYYHLGDAVLFVMAILLGAGNGAVAGGVGSALADILSGYAIYSPVTFVIKACMGYVAGRFAKGGIWRRVLVFTLCEVLMVGGYFLFETAIYGLKTAAADIILNCIQALFGIVIGTALTGKWMQNFAKTLTDNPNEK